MPRLKDLIEVKDVNINLFREFRSYFVDDAKIQGPSLYTSVESLRTDLSSEVKILYASTSGESIGQIRQHMKDLYPQNSFWIEDDAWFTRLKASIIERIRTRGLKSCEVLPGSTYGIDRTTPETLCDHILRQTNRSQTVERLYMT